MSSKMKDHGILLYKMVELSKLLFPKYNDQIIRILSKRDEIAGYADHADTLGGWTLDEILVPIVDKMADHIADKDNPHEETAHSMDTFTREDLDFFLKDKVFSGHSPFDVYGYDFDDWTPLDLNSLFNIEGSSVTTLEHEIIIKGNRYPLEESITDLSAISSSWSNKNWYVYAELFEGHARIVYSLSYLEEELTFIYLGMKNSNDVFNIKPIVRVDTYRLSTASIGDGIAVGLEDLESTRGIDLRWRPTTDVLRPERPPRVDIELLSYDKDEEGITGFIDTSEYDGKTLYQLNQRQNRNMFFRLDGEGVITTSYTVNVITGATPTISKISNTQYRVRAPSYSLFSVTYRATNDENDFEEITLYYEIRTDLTITYGSGINNTGFGRHLGLDAAMFLINTSGSIILKLTGENVTTRVVTTVEAGSGYSVTRVSNTRYDVVASPRTGLVRLNFTAVDKYGRIATYQMYFRIENVGIRLVRYDKNASGNGGFIEAPDYLHLNQGSTSNVYFALEGTGVTSKVEFVSQLGGSVRPTVSKISNTQYRVSGSGYGAARFRFVATIPSGATASLTMEFEIRPTLSIRLSGTSNVFIGNSGTINLTLTGRGLSTVGSVDSSAWSMRGSVTSYTYTSPRFRSNTTARFTVVDHYGRRASASMPLSCYDTITARSTGGTRVVGSSRFSNTSYVGATYILTLTGTHIDFRTGTVAGGSTYRIINNGKVYGAGGNGANGSRTAMSSGRPGGTALTLNQNISWSGAQPIGGGGGGGARNTNAYAPETFWAYAGGGGGAPNGSGGTSRHSTVKYSKTGEVAYNKSANGNSGGSEYGGFGGYYQWVGDSPGAIASGGLGGNVGQPGRRPAGNYSPSFSANTSPGGSSGAAVNRNGYSM